MFVNGPIAITSIDFGWLTTALTRKSTAEVASGVNESKFFRFLPSEPDIHTSRPDMGLLSPTYVGIVLFSKEHRCIAIAERNRVSP